MEIHIKNATKKLKETVVLNDITLSLDNKNRYGLTGQNGSGKTMLLRSICGFLKLDSGEVYIDENKIGSPNYEFIHDAGVIVGKWTFITPFPDWIICGFWRKSDRKLVMMRYLMYWTRWGFMRQGIRNTENIPWE